LRSLSGSLAPRGYRAECFAGVKSLGLLRSKSFDAENKRGFAAGANQQRFRKIAPRSTMPTRPVRRFSYTNCWSKSMNLTKKRSARWVIDGIFRNPSQKKESRENQGLEPRGARSAKR